MIFVGMFDNECIIYFEKRGVQYDAEDEFVFIKT